MSDPVVADFLLVGASELVTCAGSAPARGKDQARVAVVEHGAVAARNGTIVWAGKQSDLENNVTLTDDAHRIDAGGRAVLPGLVDAHTHLVWAGDRADEFEKRLAGATYSEIAAAGGGILRTVDATRAASREQLAALARLRMDRLARWGVTSLEVKSGYGLDAETELRILQAALDAAAERNYEVATTFLGAHTVPREARGNAQARASYLDLVCDDLIPQVAEEKLAQFVDVFVDDHAFSLQEAERVLTAAHDHDLGVKIHADQLSDDGGAALAARMKATSADHLEHSSEQGLRALSNAGVVAVLIPGASLFLKMNNYANARRMIELDVPVALATDLNPGTCPCDSLPLIMQLGCLLCGLSVDEAIVAATLNAAAAIGLADRAGSIEPGKRCDLLVLDTPDRRQLFYQFGSPKLHQVITRSQPVYL